jgi:hypothetical protein
MDPVRVFNSGGAEVWSSTAPGAATCPVPRYVTLAPGASAPPDQYRWDQVSNTNCAPSPCPSTPVPPGPYTARGYWHLAAGGVIQSNAISFQIT